MEECQDRGDDDRVVTISQEGQASESIRLSLNKVTAANELSMVSPTNWFIYTWRDGADLSMYIRP